MRSRQPVGRQLRSPPQNIHFKNIIRLKQPFGSSFVPPNQNELSNGTTKNIVVRLIRNRQRPDCVATRQDAALRLPQQFDRDSLRPTNVDPGTWGDAANAPRHRVLRIAPPQTLNLDPSVPIIRRKVTDRRHP